MSAPFAPRSTGSTQSILQETFGLKGKRGAIGERYYERGLNVFADHVSNRKPPHRYALAHSLNIPRRRDGKKFNTDVDFGAASGNKLLLIDAKRWAPGFYCSIPLPRGHTIGVRILRPHSAEEVLNVSKWILPHVDGKWRLSRNMEMAVERYQEQLPGVEVRGIVVFVPTDKPRDSHRVSLLRWPGRIRTYTAEASYMEIEAWLGAPEPVNPKITALLDQQKRR
jgi:hypothetical protein